MSLVCCEAPAQANASGSGEAQTDRKSGRSRETKKSYTERGNGQHERRQWMRRMLRKNDETARQTGEDTEGKEMMQAQRRELMGTEIRQGTRAAKAV